MVHFASYLRRVLCKMRLIFPRINGPTISLHVNVDDSNVQNKQICVQLHFIALKRLSIKLLFTGQVILTHFYYICRSSILTAKLAR